MKFKDLSTRSFGKSVKVLQAPPKFINGLHDRGMMEVPNEMEVHPNQPLVLKCGQQSCLARVGRRKRFVIRVTGDMPDPNLGITGRNKEQTLLQHLLQDPKVRCIVITGPAGTGKTTVAGAYALEQLWQNDSGPEKLYLSKPLEIVTGTSYWGTVPGDEHDKFAPFLKSFELIFKSLVSERGHKYIETAMQKDVIEFMPLELMRGATLKECFCWFDEAQNLNNHEVETLGSRIDDEGDSKLILSGDLGQIDRRINKEHTGLMKLVNSPHFLESEHTAHVDLIQNERGEISQMFFDVFND